MRSHRAAQLPVVLATALATASGLALGSPAAAASAAPAATAGSIPGAQAAVVSTSAASQDVFFRGSDQSVQHSFTRNGGVTYHRSSLGGAITAQPAVVARAQPALRYDLFVRGTNGYLYHNFYSAGWRGFQYLGVRLGGTPTAVSWAPGRLDAFYVSATDNLGHTWYDGAWHTESLVTPGVTLGGHPVAVSYAVGALDVFYRGSDGALHRAYYNSTSGGWRYVNLTGQILGDPAVTAQLSGGTAQIRVFVRGVTGAPYVNTITGATSAGYTRLGGALGSDPAATSWTGRFDMVAAGTDANLYQWTSTGGAYSAPRRAATGLNGTPAAISPATGRIDVYYRGPNKALLHVTYSAANNTWSTPQFLGGGFS